MDWRGTHQITDNPRPGKTVADIGRVQGAGGMEEMRGMKSGPDTVPYRNKDVEEGGSEEILSSHDCLTRLTHHLARSPSL